MTSNPNAHLNIPKWVNEDYFNDILNKNVSNFNKIVSFSPVAATAPGENYTSIMIRVHIEYVLNDGEKEKKSYILKTFLESSESSALTTSMQLFPKEVNMYKNLIPAFEKLFKDAGIEIKFGPKCLHIEETPERITFVMEDLKQWNFTNMDRLHGLDLKHSEQILIKLAELHAASAVYEELNGSYDQMFLISMYVEQNRQLFIDMGKMYEKILFKAMRSWSMEDIESYIAKLPDPEKAFNEALRINSADPNEFNVLNHGDCWVNNFMYRHNENNEIAETIFVDFQIAHWGSPAQDLWYLIMSSTSNDIRVKHFDYLINVYHTRLTECLKLLKYSKHIPSLKELHITLLKNSYWSTTTATTVMTVMLFPSDKDMNMENLMKVGPESDELRFKTFTTPVYVEAMKQILPFLDNKGILTL